MLEGCLRVWAGAQKGPVLGRSAAQVLGNHWSSHRPKLSSPVGRGSSAPLHVCTHLPHLLQVYTHAIPFSRGPASPHPSSTPPLTFHRRCADKAGLWGTGTDPGRCCTPGTACPSAGPPGQGCLPLFAMVPTGGSCHTPHQPAPEMGILEASAPYLK